MSMTIDGTSGLTFPNGSGQDVGAVGVGQTWQNVTASRAANTTYTNSTGKPIQVSVSAAVTSGRLDLYLTIGGVTAARSTSSASSEPNCVYGIVPNGATYSFSPSGGFTIVNWAELR